MADSEDSPRPFRRERNLSNRNFRRQSGRHTSTDSYSSTQESIAHPSTPVTTQSNTSNTNGSISSTSDPFAATPSSSWHYTYSVNSESSESVFNQRSLLKMKPPDDDRSPPEGQSSPTSPDPALLDVRQKVRHFETLQAEERMLRKTGRLIQRANLLQSQSQVCPVLPLPVDGKRLANAQLPIAASFSVSQNASCEGVRSEDEVDDFSDFEEGAENGANADAAYAGGEYILPRVAEEVTDQSHMGNDDLRKSEVLHGGVSDENGSAGNAEALQQNAMAATIPAIVTADSESLSHFSEAAAQQELGISGSILKQSAKNFPRNFRSTPRPKTEIIGIKNHQVINKFNSVYEPKETVANTDEEEEEEAELRNKCEKFINPILEELIKTEETYVESLLVGIKNYGNIFERRDLPMGLRGKKYVLLGNIETIAEFHRTEFLPMLHRNRRDLKRLFDDFQILIDQNCFYGYVIFTMNKQKSLKLCDVFKNYFKLIQNELDDKLGINSFLVQPIQRMARYPLLLQQFITTMFKNRDYVMKPLIESCCRLEKKVRTLLTTTNESEVINDIVECNEFNVFYQGKFRKVSDFSVFDHTLKRSYRSKVFIFDKCIIYTEIRGKCLLFHGRYSCEHIGIVAKTKSFTLFYERRKQQECDFSGDPVLVETWLELIRDMIGSYVTEERSKLNERCMQDHLHRKPPSLSLFRDSNRFSSDSGIGNIWVMPKPDVDLETVGNRTTWYAVT